MSDNSFPWKAGMFNNSLLIPQELLPLTETQQFADLMGLMVVIWEDPSGQPDIPAEDVGKITFAIGLPELAGSSTDKGNFWEESILKAAYEAGDSKALILECWEKTVAGLHELLDAEDIQACRCPDCGAWYSHLNPEPHECETPETTDAPAAEATEI